MSYISILLPAFRLNIKDTNRIKDICSTQFNTSKDEIDIIEFESGDNNLNYGIKFNTSSLSLNSIEHLIYEKNCFNVLTEKVFESLNNITEKVFESLDTMSKKMEELEQKLNSYSLNNINITDDNKLKSLIESKIEYSDIIKKNLNKIKEDFKLIVLNMEKIRKKNEFEDKKEKKYINNNYIINNYFCESSLNGSNIISNNSSKEININNNENNINNI